MKFLIDAQLPQKFAGWLKEHGHDAIHTLDLPKKNATLDGEVIQYAVTESRIVVSKDSDFVQAFLVNGEPSLLLISTGNIFNQGLENLLKVNLNAIVKAFEDNCFVEITSDGLITHE
jgi:predicted nuclease of predicted toxin-antitoxin system